MDESFLKMILDGHLKGNFSEELFYGYVESDIIFEAWALLVEEFPVLNDIKTSRQLMAFSIYLLRNFAPEEEEVELEEEELEDYESFDELEDLEEDPEDVKEALFSMLMSGARSYLRQKFLQKLFNSEIRFKDVSGDESHLFVNGREFYFEHDPKAQRSFKSDAKWTYEAFEFLRVLSTEIFRVYEEDCNITIYTKNNSRKRLKEMNLDHWWNYLRN